MKKRFLQFASAMLAVVMIVGVLPLGVFAEGLSLPGMVQRKHRAA